MSPAGVPLTLRSDVRLVVSAKGTEPESSQPCIGTSQESVLSKSELQDILLDPEITEVAPSKEPNQKEPEGIRTQPDGTAGSAKFGGFVVEPHCF